MNSPWELGWPDLLRSMGCGVGPPLVSPPAARGPSVHFLHKKVWDGRALGWLYQVTIVSSVYPAASPEGVRWGTPWQRRSRLPRAGSPWGCPGASVQLGFPTARPCTMCTLSACCWGSTFHTRRLPWGAPSAQVGRAFFQGSPIATWVGWPRLALCRALPRRPPCFPRANVGCTGARMTLPPQPCRRKGLGHGLSG